MKLKAGLYLVATPIGNLEDITLRALKTLQNSDIILCEDSRISGRLLAKYKICQQLEVYNDHSCSLQRSKIITKIQSGNVVSLISDAGMPLVSDPGYKLVQDVIRENLLVDCLPGPSSVICALALSGLRPDKFYFSGFLPKTSIQRIQTLEELAEIDATLIFFESAKRIGKTLIDIKQTLGERKVTIARELTKLYQEIISGSASELIEKIKHPLKGEIVLLIKGNDKKAANSDQIQQEIANLLQYGMSAKGATDYIYNKSNKALKRADIYNIANAIKNNS